MGCDIHFVIEKRKTQYDEKTGDSAPTGEWFGVYSTWDTPHPISDSEPLPSDEINGFMGGASRMPAMKSRNYAFFAKLAGVRGDGPDPRGFPDDASALARDRLSLEDSDLHSHSWATMDEFVEAWLLTCTDTPKTAKTIEHMLNGKREQLINYVAGTFGDVEEYRVLYAFDN